MIGDTTETGILFLMDTAGPAAMMTAIAVGIPLVIVTTSFGWSVWWCVVPTAGVFLALFARFVGASLKEAIKDAGRSGYNAGRWDMQQKQADEEP